MTAALRMTDDVLHARAHPTVGAAAHVPWKRLIGVVVMAALLRTALVAAKDGYFQAGLYPLAIASSFRHLWTGALVCGSWCAVIAWSRCAMRFSKTVSVSRGAARAIRTFSISRRCTS